MVNTKIENKHNIYVHTLDNEIIQSVNVFGKTTNKFSYTQTTELKKLVLFLSFLITVLKIK